MQKKYKLATFIVISLIVPMFIIPFLPDKISEFYYREITYTKIATNNNAEDRNTRIEKVFKYVSKISHDPTEIYSLVDKNSFIDAIRGIGWCDQQAFLLMNLLNKLGIKKTRLRDVQAHTVAEVLVDGKWILVDPFAGIIFTDKNNAFIGIGDLDNDGVSDVMGVVRASMKYQTNLSYGNNYQKIYIPNEIRWKDGISPEFLDYRAYDFIRSFFELYSNFVFWVFGDKYYHWVQDIYLQTDKVNHMHDQGELWIKEYLKHYEQNDDAFRIFYKARNYDLADRSVRAHSMYVQVINQFQDTFWAQESKYYLALLEYESSHYNKAEKLLIDLNTNYLIRNNLVKYYLGLINLVNKDYAKAKEYFMQSHYHYSRIELYKLDKNK